MEVAELTLKARQYYWRVYEGHGFPAPKEYHVIWHLPRKGLWKSPRYKLHKQIGWNVWGRTRVFSWGLILPPIVDVLVVTVREWYPLAHEERRTDPMPSSISIAITQPSQTFKCACSSIAECLKEDQVPLPSYLPSGHQGERDQNHALY